MNNVIENILKRRSTRVFTDEPIKKEILEEIVKAGIYAPSAMNQQPWHFTVVTNKNLLDEISYITKEVAKKNPMEYIRNYANNEKFHIFYNSPAVIIISQEDKAYEPDIDCAAASENMLLAAESFDIGSCWIGFVSFLFKDDFEKSQEYRSKLGIPNGFTPIHAISLGQKKISNLPAPKRRESTVNFVE